MKTSWFIGVVAMWLIIMACEMVVVGNSTPAGTSEISVIASPPITNLADFVSTAITMATNIGIFFFNLLSMFLLWSPSVFTGNWVWAWWFVCVPIDAGMVFGIVTVLRGVHSS